MSEAVIHDLVATGGIYQIAAVWEYTDPNIYGPSNIAHYNFEVQWSLAPDMSSPTSFFWHSNGTTIQSGGGDTLYIRVRSWSRRSGFGGSSPVNPGPWSDIVSATETSDPNDPWQDTFTSFEPDLALGAGSFSVSAGNSNGRYRVMGKTLQFYIDISIGTVTGGSGFCRVGTLPFAPRSGRTYVVTASNIKNVGVQSLLVGKVIDAGSNTAKIELSLYDGSYPLGISNNVIRLGGAYEID